MKRDMVGYVLCDYRTVSYLNTDLHLCIHCSSGTGLFGMSMMHHVLAAG